VYGDFDSQTKLVCWTGSSGPGGVARCYMMMARRRHLDHRWGCWEVELSSDGFCS
jgi:hypothetical protein